MRGLQKTVRSTPRRLEPEQNRAVQKGQVQAHKEDGITARATEAENLFLRESKSSRDFSRW